MVATTVAIWAVSRSALRVRAASPSSFASGSSAPSAETTVRSAAIGCAVLGSACRIESAASGSLRCPASSFRKASSCARVGRVPRWRRKTVSSKVECSARPWMSIPR